MSANRLFFMLVRSRSEMDRVRDCLAWLESIFSAVAWSESIVVLDEKGIEL